ncbi:MAG: hypothetical protein ACYCW6_16925 [Candidatus Xenobia bacterium]
MPTTTLTGNGLQIHPMQVPIFQVFDARGTSPASGWNIVFKLTGNLVGTLPANVIAGSNFTMTASGGTVSPSTSSDPSPNLETGNSSDLLAGVKAVSATLSSGAGNYSYTPADSEFTLKIPDNAVADTYSSTIQVTLSSGP